MIVVVVVAIVVDDTLEKCRVREPKLLAGFYFHDMRRVSNRVGCVLKIQVQNVDCNLHRANVVFCCRRRRRRSRRRR